MRLVLFFRKQCPGMAGGLDDFELDFLAEDAFSDQPQSKGKRKKPADVNVKMQRMVDPLKQFEMFPNGHPRFLTKGSKVKILNAQMHFASTMGCFDYGTRQPTQTAHVTEQDVADLNAALGSTEGISRSARLRKRKAIASNPESNAALLVSSSETLPEPVWDMGIEADPSSVVTLRVRSIAPPIMKLPDFSEGDIIVGIVQLKRRRARGSEDGSEDEGADKDREDEDATATSNGEDDEDDEDDTGTNPVRVFRVHGVYWGIRAYVNMVMDGLASAEVRRAAAARSRSENNCFLVCSVVKEAEQ